MVRSVQRALESDVPEGAVAGGMAGEDHVDVDAGAVHCLGSDTRVPVRLDRRNLAVGARGPRCAAAALRGQAEGVVDPHGPARVELFDDGVTRLEERIPLAVRFLLR